MDRRTFLMAVAAVPLAAVTVKQALAVDAGPFLLRGRPVFWDAHCAQGRFFVVPDAVWDEAEAAAGAFGAYWDDLTDGD